MLASGAMRVRNRWHFDGLYFDWLRWGFGASDLRDYGKPGGVLRTFALGPLYVAFIDDAAHDDL